jgi:hypothetical protein
MQTHERIGHGYILKRSKRAGHWLIDPFVLRSDKHILILDRTAKRAHLITERPYRLVNPRIDELRKLSDEELSALRDDIDFSKRLPEDSSPNDFRCFEISFTDENKDKTITIVAPFIEIVENLHRKMGEYIYKVPEAGPTVEQLLGPVLKPVQSQSQMVVTHKLTMIYDDKEPPRTVNE